MKETALYFIISILFTLTISQATYAAPPDRRDSNVLPSISTKDEANEEIMSWAYLCYSLRFGMPLGCTIRNHTLRTVEDSVDLGIKIKDCEIDSNEGVVPGTCADGGHKHETTSNVRPRSRIFDGPDNATVIERQPLNQQAPLAFDAVDEDPGNPFNVKGPMLANRWVLVKYPTPDNAGSFYWQAQVDPPPCSILPLLCGFFGRGAQDDGSQIWDGTVNVGFDGLRQLPEDLSRYRKVRGGPNGNGTDRRHIDEVSFAGDPTAILAMQLIAQAYKTKTTRLLQPNDMSLPFGGLFHVFGRYRPAGGHFTHREGRDIDLNRRSRILLDGGNDGGEELTECENDTDLFEAVNKVLVPVPGRIPRKGEGGMLGPGGSLPPKETALLCEINPPPPDPPDPPDPDVFGRYHIDITFINLLSLFIFFE